MKNAALFSIEEKHKIKRSSEDGTQLQQACEESTNTATPCNIS